MSREKSRLTGELDSLRKRLEELEGKAKTEFDCTVEQLPELITGFDEATEKSLTKAEISLGLKQPEVDGDSLT